MAFSGTYRGVRFRSLLELATIRNLEAAGLELGTTMLYESTRIPYGKDGQRTYLVDLTLPQMRKLVEVKPSSRIGNRNNRAKRLAAERWCAENGWEYLIVTEEELERLGGTITLEEAVATDGVTMNPRAVKSLGRKMRAKARRDRKKRKR